MLLFRYPDFAKRFTNAVVNVIIGATIAFAVPNRTSAQELGFSPSVQEDFEGDTLGIFQKIYPDGCLDVAGDCSAKTNPVLKCSWMSNDGLPPTELMTSPKSGGKFLHPVPFECRDLHHKRTIYRSLPFSVGPYTSIVVPLTGGATSGIETGYMPQKESDLAFATNADTGIKAVGVAIRVNGGPAGKYVVAKGRATAGVDWESITFTPCELAPYVGTAITIDIFDSYAGPWGWLGVDEVKINNPDINEVSLCSKGNDTNGDGYFGIGDVICVLQVAMWRNYQCVGPIPSCISPLGIALADVNCDGSINAVDVQTIVRIAIGAPLPFTMDSNTNLCPDDCE